MDSNGGKCQGGSAHGVTATKPVEIATPQPHGASQLHLQPPLILRPRVAALCARQRLRHLRTCRDANHDAPSGRAAPGTPPQRSAAEHPTAVGARLRAGGRSGAGEASRRDSYGGRSFAYLAGHAFRRSSWGRPAPESGSEEGDSEGSPARSTCEPTSQSAPEEHQDQGNGIKAGDGKSAMMNAGGGQTAPGRSMAL
jgi:hypothetical protein